MMAVEKQRGLGTLLRELIALLDGGVDAWYTEEGLPLRSRYTPVFKTLLRRDTATIKMLALEAGVSHSALSQTVSQMVRDGLVSRTTGSDPRERHVRLTPRALELAPRIVEGWAAFEAASGTVSAQIGHDLPRVCALAIDALKKDPFAARIEAARRS